MARGLSSPVTAQNGTGLQVAGKGTYLCSQDTRGASQRQSLQPSGVGALCGWQDGRKVCWGSILGPSTIYMSIVKPKLLQGWPHPGPLLLPSPQSLKPLAASRHLANSSGGICHPLQALSVGKYINRQASFGNNPKTPCWET